ncbi:helix-turn-helix domain-containing protein [Actinomadura mexicana]|uniref:PucR C-terminal helix-turn-helix domain-containing protein n=1 Tax=Actinomadura mexicana TaxID=134959 RepID=A0A239FEU4_9ACTN|nr:helix-turn-helix domain-containing protein [Actinomadura mexicana]SNS54692.1 PucR C-terminal helix-turn-helix domain-containing protein [Actinomadura mexicana]
MPAELPDVLRQHLQAAVDEMEREIRDQVPEYAGADGGEYARKVERTVSDTVAFFVDSVDHPTADARKITELYMRLGEEEARHGRSLAALQNAMRVSSQVACRRFIKDAYRLGWSRETLGRLTDSLFLLLARAADAAAQGYAREQGQLATERERRRDRLRDLLVAEPPPGHEAIAELAVAARWELPKSIGLVALPAGAPAGARILPPAVLADWEAPVPFLVVPDPEGPGQDRLWPALRRLGTSALGPTVPIGQGAVSLRWARHALTLAERGLLPDDGPVRCVDHIASLATLAAEELVDATAEAALGPLLELPPARRQPLAETLLTYLQCGDNAVIAAERLHIHEQTVRYRLRRITELTGGRFTEPDGRLDLMVMLSWLVRTGRADRAERTA